MKSTHNKNAAVSIEQASKATGCQSSGSKSGALDNVSALSKRLFALCYLLFFLSGTAALVYEISWSRQVGLLFGHTVHAAAVVLSSYFAGMAIGHFLGAKWSPRVSPLVGYGVAELVVAGWACLIPFLLSRFQSQEIVAWLNGSSFAWQMTKRAVLCFLLLLPATTALGVTLPMMAELLARQRSHDVADSTNAARVSLAYALNTAGALVGVLSATFLLLVVVGVSTSSYVAAAASATCGLGALLVGTRQAARVERPPCSASKLPTFNSGLSFYWLCLAALSGFGTLALEVLYVRTFALVLHNSTYTFGAVVAVFLASLATGAALAAVLQRRYKVEGLLGWAAVLGALATTFSVLAFVRLTGLDYYRYGETFSQYVGGVLLVVAIVVAPPITLLGTLLPLVWKAAGRGRKAGNVVGRLTAVNTIAAALGALAASFLLLPYVGLWQSFVLIAGLFFVTGFVLLLRQGRLVWACGGAVALGVLALLALIIPVETNAQRRKDRGEQLVRHWNSSYGWIDVVRDKKTGSFRVLQNLHYRFGGTTQKAPQHRMGHVPLLLHEHPKDVLFLGLGTGLTASGALPHPEVEDVVVVELIPEDVEAARLLAEHNSGVVEHPKVKVHVDDARHYLLATDRRFDVIISDLFVPWESETGYLYTVEHYQVARQRLKPGGLFCQWLPLYQLGAREMEMIADSFASVFGVTTIWWGKMDATVPVIALVGSSGPIDLDAERLEARLATLWRATKSVDDSLRTVEDFYVNYQGDWTVRHPSRLNTDEHPRIEFLTPISHRDHKLVGGRALQECYDNELSRLPSTAIRLRGSGQGTSMTPRQRRAWQRFLLFGTSKSMK